MIILAIVALSVVVITALAAALGTLPSYPTAVVTYANLFLSYIGIFLTTHMTSLYPS